ncbi:MAG: cadherin-like domain-containing protein [Pseudomonadota bacterium]
MRTIKLALNSKVGVISASALAFTSVTAAQSQQTQYFYDDLGRLKRADYGVDATQEYHYDAAGNRSAVLTGPLGLPPNSPPTAVGDSVSGPEDQSITIQPLTNDSDPDNNSLSLQGVTGADYGSVSVSGGTVTFTPNTNWHGTDDLSYTVSDGTTTSEGAISVTITPVNDPPNAGNDSASTNEDTSITFNPRGNDTDPDGNSLTIVSKTNGSRGFVSIIGGAQLRYTPNTNTNGSDSFSYTISDGTATDTATVSMTVNPINDPPNAQSDTFYNVSRNNWTTLNVRGNDSDIDSATFLVTSVASSEAQVQILNGGATVRMRCPNCSATETGFTYVLTDTQGATDTAGVTVFLQQGGGGGGGGGLPLF